MTFAIVVGGGGGGGIDLRNRIVVAANRFWSHFTFGGGIRLIAGNVVARDQSG